MPKKILKIAKARNLAIKYHKKQMYGKNPYVFHLDGVVRILKDFGYSSDFLIAGYLHDTIEDTELTLSTIKKEFGENVSKLVKSVTDPKIGTRKEKKRQVYKQINQYSLSLVVKLADRIANVQASLKIANLSKLEMYKSEQKEFKNATQNIKSLRITKLWNCLESLLEASV